MGRGAGKIRTSSITPINACQRNSAKVCQRPCIFYLNVFMINPMADMSAKSFRMDTA